MVEIFEKLDNINKVMKQLEFLKNNSVYVGIPENKGIRKEYKGSQGTSDKEQVTNAELLFIHTNGSPVNNIPPRPVIEPALKADKERISNMLKRAAKLSLDNDESSAITELKKVGMRGQNVCRAWFTNSENKWPPNAPSVIARKKRKKSTNPRPLIDTGELRRSITYVLVQSGRRVND